MRLLTIPFTLALLVCLASESFGQKSNIELALELETPIPSLGKSNLVVPNITHFPGDEVEAYAVKPYRQAQTYGTENRSFQNARSSKSRTSSTVTSESNSSANTDSSRISTEIEARSDVDEIDNGLTGSHLSQNSQTDATEETETDESKGWSWITIAIVVGIGVVVLAQIFD